MQREKWIPALNRYKFVLKNYDRSVYVEEALHRLVEIHYKIGLVEESKKYASIAEYYGASVPFLRPKEISGDNSPDIDWVSFTLKNLKEKYDCFSFYQRSTCNCSTWCY